MNVRHRSMHSLVCTSGAMAAVLLGGAVSTASAAASLTPLGVLPDGSFWSEAHGVSGDGSVVVGRSGSATRAQPFYWTADGGMVGLGDLSPGGGSYSGAHGVSADGSVIIGVGISASGQEAFRWTAAGGMQGLGDLPGGLFSSQASGVSADGLVVVGDSSSAFGQQAFRWTSGGGIIGLGDLPGGGFYSWASGVSADGSVIVGSGTSASGRQAFRWTSDGGMVGLGHLPGGTSNSGADDVSGDGSVIVGWSDSASGVQAFRWTSDGGMVGLGHLPGSFGNQAYGVSADGSVIVGSSDNEAFRWTAASGMERLRDVLLANGVNPAADGWGLGPALGISADGNTIVGYGYHNGNSSEAFVAVVPVPTGPPGDFNQDGTVDAADYVVWRKTIGTPTAYNTWRDNFGATLGSVASEAATTSVPEPAAGALALLGVSSILLLRRRSLWRPNKHPIAGRLKGAIR